MCKWVIPSKLNWDSPLYITEFIYSRTVITSQALFKVQLSHKIQNRSFNLGFGLKSEKLFMDWIPLFLVKRHKLEVKVNYDKHVYCNSFYPC